MAKPNKTTYTSRLSVHITTAMNHRLDQIALLRDEAKAEVVREALRLYLDQQEDLLGSRKHFTKMFQRRMTYVERLLAISLGLNIQVAQILLQRVNKQRYDLAELLQETIQTGVVTEDVLHTLVEKAVAEKRKPPAP